VVVLTGGCADADVPTAAVTAIGPTVSSVGPTVISPVGPTVISPVGPTVISPVGPTAVTAIGPTVSSAGPTVSSAVGPTVSPVGFAEVRVVIRRADSTICELCTYLARLPADRQRGLMGVTDLAGLDGMIFVYDTPGVLPFWMKDTVMPLSAAWFADGGAYIAAKEMAPCAAGTEQCPSYGPSVSARYVLEVPQGDLTRFGIGPGSTLVEYAGPCEPAGRG